MISRYTLYDIAEISKRFSLIQGLPKGIKPDYNISPTKSAPVIISVDGARVIQHMKWGLVAKGAKDTNSVFRYKTYNIPSENILHRHSWEQAVRDRRCLVPANGFYQLNGSGKKRAYYTQPDSKSLVAFAGVYSSWEDPDGIVHGTYSIITAEARSSEVLGSNSRAPIIIRTEDEARWLDPSITDASSIYDMIRPQPDEHFTTYEVDPAVHSPKQSRPQLIDRIT
jgi:putative SOS response-associated peptidase YedK